MFQNYPNPFSEMTKVGFELPKAGQMDLQIMDAKGKVIRTISGDYAAGYHEILLEANDLPEGLMYYTIRSNGYVVTKKMVLVRKP